MLSVCYDKYIQDYKNAIHVLNKREYTENKKETLNEEKKKKLTTLKSIIQKITEYETKQADLEKLS